tara:strand:+ start:2118 stop:3770 length:1653 start_codon:yes stop_codon:yes gene_type:complete
MREKKFNFYKAKIYKFFQEKKYSKISKISKTIFKIYNNDKEIHKILIFSEIKEKNLDKALNASKKLLIIKDDAETNYIHGNVLKLQNKFQDAIIFYKKAIEYKKDYFEAYNNLASSQKKLGLVDDALKNYKISLKISENNLEAYFNLGNLFYDEKKFNDALNCYEKVIEINEEFSKSYLLIGQIKSILGKFDEAKRYFLKAIDKDKFLSDAYVQYVNTRKIEKDDKIIGILKELLEKNNLDIKCNQDFSYALSKVYFDLENINLGFKFLSKAKKIYLKRINFSIEKEQETFKKVKEYFDLNKIPKPEFKIKYNISPIFILGMPRSGTSLLEQIISTHSSVHGAGELKILPKIVYDSNWNKNTNPEELFKFIRKEYFEDIKKLNANKKYIVDKMPFNFFSIGFIINSIPEAKIIHMLRNPMAVCWSNYKSNFFDNVGMDYAHKLESIAEYYVMYSDLMNFWKKMYSNSLIEINYDKFVLDPELNSKKIITDLGLNWEDKILKFYENKRTVETNSLFQVRSKIYQDSSKNWEKYEEYLSPVMSILKKNNIKF